MPTQYYILFISVSCKVYKKNIHASKKYDQNWNTVIEVRSSVSLHFLSDNKRIHSKVIYKSCYEELLPKLLIKDLEVKSGGAL